MFDDTIDQLLSYLTFRDSKTAVIFFVKSKEITPILQKVRNYTPVHKHHISEKGEKAENWFEHIFHLPLDNNKEVVVSILIFHLPDK